MSVSERIEEIDVYGIYIPVCIPIPLACMYIRASKFWVKKGRVRELHCKSKVQNYSFSYHYVTFGIWNVIVLLLDMHP